MKLFYSTGACSLAPHIVLAELNMVYELEAVNLKDKTCASGDYNKINMKGAVPALKMDNGEILTEGAIISQYIADQKNDGTLLPKFGTTERARTLEWMNFISTDVHKNFSPLFFAERLFATVDSQLEVKTVYKKILTDKFNFIAEKLGQNDYLMGNQFTIADAYMFTCLSWTKYVGLDLNNWSNLNTYVKRVSERPAVMRAMKEEGMIK
jgi:glutathione S-transferase